MRLTSEALFKSGPIEAAIAEAVWRIDQAVAGLKPGQLEDPSLPARLAERLAPSPPRLGEQASYELFETEPPEADAAPRSVEGWSVGAEAIVPYRGGKTLFALRAGAEPFMTVKAVVRTRSLTFTAMRSDGDPDRLIEDLDGQIESVRRELDEQRRYCLAARKKLEKAARHSIEARRRRLACMTQVAGALEARGWIPVRRTPK